MNEQRIPQVERVIRTYDEGLGWGMVTEVETAEREDGKDAFLSITFTFGPDKIKMDESVVAKLFELVGSICRMDDFKVT